MSRSVLRSLLLTILIVAALVAGLFAADRRTRVDRLLTTQEELNAHLDHLVASTIEIASAQQAYVVPGEREALMQRASSALSGLAVNIRSLMSAVHSESADRSLRAIEDASRTLSQVDERARQNLQVGQELMAADLVANEAGPAASSIIEEVARIRGAETTALASGRGVLFAQLWAVLGGTALLWIVGLVLLARPAAAPAVTKDPAPAANAVEPPTPAPAAQHPESVDLVGAARICADISRLARSDQLSAILSRVTTTLGARGVVVWMSAGDELFAALSHGYDPETIARLGRIGRSHDNATTSAWRSGDLRTVSGDDASNAAIVAPMCAGDRCIGVLAVELRQGQERDAGRQALTTMIAAQLASVVIAWPAPSVAEPGPTESLSSVAS